MIALEGKLRQDLVDFLSSLQVLGTVDGVQNVLKNAGEGDLISRIKVSSSLRLYIGNVADFLAGWGEIEGQEALVLFLLALYQEVGSDGKKVLDGFIDAIQNKQKILPGLDQPVTPTPTHLISEKLIGEPTLLPIAFLQRAVRLANAVAYIEINSNLGTGFMITPNFLLTCNHVLPDEESANQALFRFNYQQNIDAGIGPTKDYKRKNGGVFHTSNDFDYTVVEIAGQPGIEWGVIEVPTILISPVKVDGRVNIIQHPGGRPKQLSFRNNFVEYLDEKVIQYVTHTESGSSGSPVFNDDWELVALHHAGGIIREPSTQRRYYRNEGIIVKAILGNLPIAIQSYIEKTL